MSGARACDRCAGNGEIVTDWGRYLQPRPHDEGDVAVAECPDCGGLGVVTDMVPPSPAEDGETKG